MPNIPNQICHLIEITNLIEHNKSSFFIEVNKFIRTVYRHYSSTEDLICRIYVICNNGEYVITRQFLLRCRIKSGELSNQITRNTFRRRTSITSQLLFETLGYIPEGRTRDVNEREKKSQWFEVITQEQKSPCIVALFIWNSKTLYKMLYIMITGNTKTRKDFLRPFLSYFFKQVKKPYYLHFPYSSVNFFISDLDAFL